MTLPLPGSVVGHKAFERPYGLGSIGYLSQLALHLAGAGTNVAADSRKGDTLTDDSQRFGIFASDNEAKIARHVNSRRTRFLAGCFRWFSVHVPSLSHGFMVAFSVCLLVSLWHRNGVPHIAHYFLSCILFVSRHFLS